jgi:1-acyl-sn-glycerol-3-phosphate acyltransferase
VSARPDERRSPALVRAFGAIMARAVRRQFHALRIARPGPPRLPPDRPAVIYLNHPSWWDPALAAVLATRCFPDRASYGPIDREALARYPFMARIGLFGIEPEGPRGGAAFLRTGLRLLADPATLLWVTAQGRFVDARARPVRLRPGLAHLARRLDRAVLVPLAVEYPFWDERTPEALCRFGRPTATEDHPGLSVGAWTALLERRLEEAMDALAGDAAARDPRPFEVLVRGTAGVGGVYDLWRRARARMRGEAFRPEHGQGGHGQEGHGQGMDGP